MAPLDRAFAIMQGDDIRPIAGDLHFDMARAGYIELAIEGAIAERGFSLGRAHRIGRFDLSRRAHDAHTAPAAAKNGLDHD